MQTVRAAWDVFFFAKALWQTFQAHRTHDDEKFDSMYIPFDLSLDLIYRCEPVVLCDVREVIDIGKKKN